MGKKPVVARKKCRRAAPARPGRHTWKKECICLRDKEQELKPSPEEKMEMARLGLGLTDIVFNNNGNAEHIHNQLTKHFPVLSSCGGYTLLRLGANSRSLVEIETPDGGLTVPYLKDILNQAKLFIIPLQTDITDEVMKPFIIHIFACYRKMSLSQPSFA